MFENKDYFIFDLDQTLYPKSSNIIKQIDNRIGAYCARLMNVSFDEGCRIGWKMNEDYGSTLGGLKAHYTVNSEDYLEYVHDVDYSELTLCHDLKNALEGISGKRYIYTNGTTLHAKRVLAKRGLSDLFEDIYGIEEANHAAKPCPNAFVKFIDTFNIVPHQSVFFDDNMNNIKTAEQLGITAFHVQEGEAEKEGCSSVKNLAQFLSGKIKA